MTNAKEEQYKAEIKELRSKLRTIESELEAQHEKALEEAEQRAERFKLDFFKVCNALLTVQNTTTMVTGALKLSDISLNFETETTFTTRPA